jgi:Uma2 family endonuclease
MSTPVATGLTYDDLLGFPEDGLRREIIDGELFVTAAPNLGHQRTLAVLSARFLAYVEEHGGEVFPAPTDVFFTDNTVVEPDVVVVRADHLDRLEERFVRSAPDVVVEVSSPHDASSRPHPQACPLRARGGARVLVRRPRSGPHRSPRAPRGSLRRSDELWPG